MLGPNAPLQSPTPLPCLRITNQTSNASKTLKSLRNDKQFADVLLLVGKSQTPFYTHANILASKSEYFKSALSSRWKSKSKLEIPKSVLADFKTSSEFMYIRAVLKHPDVHVQVMDSILEYLYSDSVEIQSDLVMEAAVFADQILLEDFKIQCVDHMFSQQEGGNGGGLTASNALELYHFCGRLNMPHPQEHAASIMKANLLESLVAGREWLAGMNAENVKEFFQNTPSFTAAHRWEVLIAWSKSLQETEYISVGSGITADFNIETAQKDTKPILSLVGLCSLSLQEYQSLVTPYHFLLPEYLRDFIRDHFESIANAPPLWESKILCRKNIQKLLTCLTAEINGIQPRLQQKSLEAELLFRGSGSGFSARAFHEACDGKVNTVTLIKLANGKLVGGYGDSAWSSEEEDIPVKEAFLFSIKFKNQGVMVLDIHALNPEVKEFQMAGLHGYGPAFGSGHDLCICKNKCSSQLGCGYLGNGITSAEFLVQGVTIRAVRLTLPSMKSVIEKINRPLTMRPAKTMKAAPCAPEISTLFNCWRALDVDAKGCTESAKALAMKTAKTSSVSDINKKLAKLRLGKTL
ncbi:hypothetical protein BDR26DRAFT_1009167 [Obelidium mucronatum]|nr:hypothetical protein BDR26DRAFT_1009167 [Obelidium mucronatum]